MTTVKNPRIIEQRSKDSYQDVEKTTILINSPEMKKIKRFSAPDLVDYFGLGGCQVLMALFAGSFFCAESCELIMLSLVSPDLKETFHLSNLQESLVGSIVFFGVSVGGFVWGWFSDKYGRKSGILICSFLLTVFGLLRSVISEYYFFNFCGFMNGFAIGGSVIGLSLFLEYLPVKGRGASFILIELFWILGAVFVVLSGWLCLTEGLIFDRYNENIFLFASKIPAFISFVLALLSPDSLNYHALCEDEESIRSTVKKMQYFNCKRLKDEEYEIVFAGGGGSTQKKNEGQQEQPQKKKKRGNVMDLFSRKLIFPFFCICIFYITSSIVYYGIVMASPNFFGEGQQQMFLGTFIFSLSELPGIIVAAISLPLLGRKPTQTITFFVCGIFLLLLCIVKNPILLIIFGFISRAAGMASSSCVWVVAQESLPTSVRSMGTGISQGLGKFGTILAPLICYMLPYQNELIPKMIFAFMSIVSGFLMIFYPLETKGKQLSDFVGEPTMVSLDGEHPSDDPSSSSTSSSSSSSSSSSMSDIEMEKTL